MVGINDAVKIGTSFVVGGSTAAMGQLAGFVSVTASKSEQVGEFKKDPRKAATDLAVAAGGYLNIPEDKMREAMGEALKGLSGVIAGDLSKKSGNSTPTTTPPTNSRER